MKKKIKLPFKLSYDAPVTLTFIILSLVFALLNGLILKNKLDFVLLSSPTKNGGQLPFNAQNFSSYIKLIFYTFGCNSWTAFFSNLVFILLLGPVIEEYYGSIIIGIMFLISSLFSGVLNACFCMQCLRGPVSIVFMLIFLNAFVSFSKKKLPLSFVLAFILYIFVIIFEQKGQNTDSSATDLLINIIVNVAGGLCGSLFAFLASPKGRANRKASKTKDEEKSIKTKAEVLAEYDDSNSPRFKNKNSEENDETTEIGTIKF